MKSSIKLCISKFLDAAAKSESLKDLKAGREKFERGLGELSEQDDEQLVSFTNKYVNSLSGNIRDRFLEPELLSPFAYFDPNYLL